MRRFCLLLLILPLLLAGCVTARLNPTSLPTSKRIGIYSDFGNTANVYSVGVTRFGIKKDTTLIPNLNIDRSLAEEAKRSLEAKGYSVKIINTQKFQPPMGSHGMTSNLTGRLKPDTRVWLQSTMRANQVEAVVLLLPTDLPLKAYSSGMDGDYGNLSFKNFGVVKFSRYPKKGTHVYGTLQFIIYDPMNNKKTHVINKSYFFFDKYNIAGWKEDEKSVFITPQQKQIVSKDLNQKYPEILSSLLEDTL